jgi:hypothetical protein
MVETKFGQIFSEFGFLRGVPVQVKSNFGKLNMADGVPMFISRDNLAHFLTEIKNSDTKPGMEHPMP